MRTRAKFMSELVGFSLKNIQRLEVKFDPFHPSSNNVREFYQGATFKKILKTNPECVTRAQTVSDLSDPLITVKFRDNHKLVINGNQLESPHIVRIIKQFEANHSDVPEDF